MSVKHKKTVLFFGNLGAMQMQQLKHLRIKNRVWEINSMKSTKFTGLLMKKKTVRYLVVRAKPCLPLWSFSLIRKTELWKTNKPPAMQVSQHCFSLQKKTSGGIINVGSPTALIYTGGIHMDNNSLSHTKWNCKYHIGATCGRCLKCAHALSPPFVIFLPRNA